MTLEKLRDELEMCCRCSACKFIPLEKVEDPHYSYICPSITRYGFHAYSGAGRLAIISAILEGRLQFSDKLVESIYNCQMCGGCDISCKYAMDMEVLEPLYELRIRCVENGHTLTALDTIIDGLKKAGTMVKNPDVTKGEWCQGLDIKNYRKQKSAVIYHVGCRTSLNKDMWNVARATVSLLQKAGVDVGIAAESEPCCGGRAYQMGYKEAFLEQAKYTMNGFLESGATTLVTSCAECYHAFKVLYDKYNILNDKIKVLHITEYLAQLISEGKLKPKNPANTKVTYHDPCHLGRLGEPYIHWEGHQLPGQMRLFDPPKEFRRGTYGVYEPPRDILKSIPGLEIVEMKRIKEYAWCCGGGGGVQESNPEYAEWTAQQRMEEAELTGADSIVTACPGCEKIFRDTIKHCGSKLKTYDIVELLNKAV